MIKYKLQFTMSAETLFGLLGKVLPIENLAVEEIVEHNVVPPDAAIRFDKRFDLPKPAKLKRKKATRTSPGPNLEAGVNKVIMEALSKGAHRAVHLKRLVGAAGYAATGIGSRLEALRRAGIVFRPEPGLYELTSERHRERQVHSKGPDAGPDRRSA